MADELKKDKYEQAIDRHYLDGIPHNLDSESWESVFIENMWDDLISSVNRNLQRFKETAYTDRMRVLRWRVVKNDQPNAGAIVLKTADGEEFDFIKINFGAIRTLHHLIHRIMAHPRNFTHIGDCHKEQVSEPIPLYHNVSRVGVELKPIRCHVRAMYAHGLLVFSITFLIFHEFSHILRGHLEYFKNVLNIIDYEEVLAMDDGGFSGLPRQALEIDADKNATFFLAKLLELSYLGLGNFAPPNSDPQKAAEFLMGSQDNQLQTIHLATYLYFRLFGEKWNFENRLSTKYPAPLVRGFVASIDAFIYIGGAATRDLDEELASKFSNSLTLIEDSIANITGVSGYDRDIVLSLTTGVDEYMEELKTCWISMLPELQAESRGNYPPVSANLSLWR